MILLLRLRGLLNLEETEICFSHHLDGIDDVKSDQIVNVGGVPLPLCNDCIKNRKLENGVIRSCGDKEVLNYANK